MHRYEFKEAATVAADRVDASLFATDEERICVRNALSAITSAGSYDVVQEEFHLIETALHAVTSRESGRSQLAIQDQQHIEDNLASLEDRLVTEIKERKASQRRDQMALMSLLTICILGSLSAGLYLAINGTTSTGSIAGAALGISAGIACSLVTARLMQNSREALERLDEKIVAVRFLRMALHPSWTSESGSQLMGSALLMFAQHFAPSSTTLGTEDMRILLENFK